MGDGFYFVDIVVFALIAGFLVFRLRSVLGRRHGDERVRPNPFVTEAGAPPPADNVITLPTRPAPVAEEEPDNEPYSLATGLSRIRAVDPTFDEKAFVQGAGQAFQMIVGAFAKGDTAALRPLLSDDVYENFARAIRARVSAGESHETRIDTISDADLLEARLEGRTAFVTIKFISQQMNVSRDANGQVIDGDASRAIEVVDIWTFARNTRSRDPNWLLVETRTSN